MSRALSTFSTCAVSVGLIECHFHMRYNQISFQLEMRPVPAWGGAHNAPHTSRLFFSWRGRHTFAIPYFPRRLLFAWCLMALSAEIGYNVP